MSSVPSHCQIDGCWEPIYRIGFPPGSAAGTWLCEQHAVELQLMGDWTDFPPAKPPQARARDTLGDTLSTPTPITTRPPAELRYSGGLTKPIAEHLLGLGYRLTRVDAEAVVA